MSIARKTVDEPRPGGSRRRRPRDPEATREVILEAARTILSKDGPEGLSLSEVAALAGVNRGTAYQHFESREKLVEATSQWVSDKLYRAAFGDPATMEERAIEQVDVADLNDRVADFGMDNPELCQVWLHRILASPDPAADPFWKEYEGSIARFADTDLSSDHIDSEVLSVLMLGGAFLWPVWARAHGKSADERKALSRRFANEVLRLCMYGTLRADQYPAVVDRLRREVGGNTTP